MSPKALRGIGWPGEKMDPASARNRLKQTLAVMRKLGLGDLVVRGRGGYMLNPSVPLTLVS